MKTVLYIHGKGGNASESTHYENLFPVAEEDFEEAITAIWESEKKYDPSVVGYK